MTLTDICKQVLTVLYPLSLEFSPCLFSNHFKTSQRDIPEYWWPRFIYKYTFSYKSALTIPMSFLFLCMNYLSRILNCKSLLLIIFFKFDFFLHKSYHPWHIEDQGMNSNVLISQTFL